MSDTPYQVADYMLRALRNDREQQSETHLIAMMAATIFGQVSRSALDASYRQGIGLTPDDFEQLAQRSMTAARRILELAKAGGQ
jgi:hypothetical protein